MAGKAIVIKTKLYPLVEKGLSNKASTQALQKHIVGFIDRNNDKLQMVGPMEQIIFTGRDIDIIFDVTGIKPESVTSIIKESPDISPTWDLANNPFYMTLTMAIRYYKIKGDRSMTKLCLSYFACALYPTLFHKYFQFKPTPAIMEYTINNLSNKYKIKQLGNLYLALVDTMLVADENNPKALINATDKEIVDYIQDKKTRLNSLFKNISIEFYNNHQNKNYLNYDFDNFSEDNYHESDSNSFEANRITDKVVMNMVVDGPKMQLVHTSAKLNQVSVNELRNYVNVLINSEHRNDIKVLVESIVSLYLISGKNSSQYIRSEHFLQYCLDVYKKSNTVDKNIINIKQVLDKWINEVGLAEKTSRLATLSAFRRALYVFFVLTIQSYN